MASEGLLLARGAYRVHPAARRSGLVADHEGYPDIIAALTAVDAAPVTFETAGGGSGYRQLARRAVLEVAQFCGDWLMSWERPGSSLATLCRTWFAWAGDRVRVSAAALALLAAAPPTQAPSALAQACQLLTPDPSAPASWSAIRERVDESACGGRSGRMAAPVAGCTYPGGLPVTSSALHVSVVIPTYNRAARRSARSLSKAPRPGPSRW